MAETFANYMSTTLTAAITTTGQTTITVASAAGFPGSAQYRIRIDSEILIVTGGAGTTTWTVTRNAEGTTATTHNSGSAVAHVLTAGALTQLKADAAALITGTAPVLVSGNNISIPNATGSQTGLMTSTQAALLATTTTAVAASSILQRDVNGDAFVRYVNATSAGTDNSAGAPTRVAGWNGSDNYLRFFNPLNMTVGAVNGQANSATIPSAVAANASQIVLRDASGNIFAAYVNANNNEFRGDAPYAIIGRTSADAYYRTWNPAAISVGYATSSGSAGSATTASAANALNSGTTDGDKLHSIDQSASGFVDSYWSRAGSFPNGKRVYGAKISATAAAAADQIIATILTPEGIQMPNNLTITGTAYGQNSQQIVIGIRASGNAAWATGVTTIEVVARTVDGTNLNTKGTTVTGLLLAVEHA